MRLCPTCRGAQTVECIGADGDYEITCPTCEGRGEVGDDTIARQVAKSDEPGALEWLRRRAALTAFGAWRAA